MSTTEKSSARSPAAPAPVKGVAIARANRSQRNTLTSEQRGALASRAMNLIDGSNGPEVPARRR